MKKSFISFLAIVFVVFLSTMAVAGGTEESSTAVDQKYFDQQFTNLQKSVAEVKGDTTQIVSILGNVFEGTVPKGGNLVSLCNQNGWNLIVLMGHNGIEDPNVVSAGAKFEYPKTTEEFQSALKKGKPLYDAWLSKQKTTFRVYRIKVDTAEIDTLNIRVANITEKLTIKNMEVDQLKIRLAEITEKLRIKNLEIESLKIENAEIGKLRIRQLEVDNLKDLLAQAQRRIKDLEMRPPKVVERAVPVTPGKVSFRQDNDCGKPYTPQSWEWDLIKKSQAEGKLPVFWYLNQQPDGTLKVKVDYFDQETGFCFTVWCQRKLPAENVAFPMVTQAGFTADEGRDILGDGGTYKTLKAGRVTNWLPGLVYK